MRSARRLLSPLRALLFCGLMLTPACSNTPPTAGPESQVRWYAEVRTLEQVSSLADCTLTIFSASDLSQMRAVRCPGSSTTTSWSVTTGPPARGVTTTHSTTVDSAGGEEKPSCVRAKLLEDRFLARIQLDNKKPKMTAEERSELLDTAHSLDDFTHSAYCVGALAPDGAK